MRSKLVSLTPDGGVVGFTKIVAALHAMSLENMRGSLGTTV